MQQLRMMKLVQILTRKQRRPPGYR
jgi:hypothetical protein